MRASDISPEYPLLGFLSLGPSHGYDLHRRLEEELLGIWSLSQSQCYSILKRLEAQKDIRGDIRQQQAAPPKRLLVLTQSGRKRYEQWLREPTPASVRAIRIEFITRLYFARIQSTTFAQELIEEQKRSLVRGIQHLETTLDEMPPSQVLNRLSLQLRIRQLESCLDWLEDCRQSLA
jgi:PadR family transcriptional regulator AphA